MITRTLKLTIAIVLMFVVLAIGSTPQVHIYRINEDTTYTSVCSDTANLETIEAYVERYHADDLGDADGYDIRQPGLQCALYNK